MKSLYDFTYEQLEDLMLSINEKKFKADQLYRWLYQSKVNCFDDMTNIKKDLIEFLNNNYSIKLLKIRETQIASDGTIKFLFELKDKNLVETVLMRFEYGNSICVTTQLGCNMGCRFCASGLLKRVRNLTSGEIVGQLITSLNYLNTHEGPNQRIDNIVVMGIGEPFDNYDNVLDFCKIVNHPKGLAIGARHITISTCGVVPKIKQFADEQKQFNLAISLHAPNDKLRSELMPINNAYNLKQLLESLKYYSNKSNRKITFEYIMIKDKNDTKECAIELSKLVKGLNSYINLINYNSVDENGYQGSSHKTMLQFYDVLMKNNVKATIRNKVGDDIDAACGQLRAKHEVKNK